MTAIIEAVVSPVQQGRTVRIVDGNVTAAGTWDYYFNTEADAVLVSLYVESVAAACDVSVYTLVEPGKELLLASFPSVIAPTSDLLLKKGVNVMSRVKVRVTTTGAATFDIFARGVSAAESSVKILGATSARASQATIPAVATLIIPASLTDRSGLVIKNNNGLGGSSLYIGFTALEATPTSGYPLVAQEALGMDLAAGVEVYGLSAAGSTDVRLLESGG